MKYFALGDSETLLGFSLAGVDGALVTTPEEAKVRFEQIISDPEIGVLIITTPIAQMIREQVDAYMLRASFPLVVELPSPFELGSTAPTDLKKLASRAIGVKL